MSTERAVMEAVEFGGLPDRSGPLTWAQRHYWTILAAHPENRGRFSIRLTWPVLPGADFELVRSAVAVLVERHEALRSRFSFTEGAPTAQRVDGSGSFPLWRREVGGEVMRGEAMHYAGAVADPEFCLDTEYPVRFQVLSSNGMPKFLVVVASHLAVDAHACGVLEAEFETLTAGKGLPAVSSQPLDWAERERSPRGMSRNRRSLEYFGKLLDEFPRPLFPRQGASDGVGGNGFPVVLGHGAGLGAKLHRLAEEWGSPVAAVALAAVSGALAKHAGVDAFPLGVTCANRFLPGAEGYVGMLAQNSALGIRVKGRTLQECAVDIQRGQMRAYLHGAYDQDDLDNLVRDTHPGIDSVGFGLVGHFVNFQHGPIPAAQSVGADVHRAPVHVWHTAPTPYRIPRFGVIVTADDQDLGVRLFADPQALSATTAEAIARTFLEELQQL